jgi:Flp pilus assembly protein TadD
VGTAIERTSRAREAISAPLHSVVRIAARHAGSVMASLILLTGCTTTQTSSSLSIEEETRPTTVSASDLDMAALGRVARVAESSGGDIIDPAQVYRRIAERQPSAPEPRVELGRLFLRRGDLDAAERSFQEALSLAPRHVDAQIGAGQVLLARSRAHDAADAFRLILENDPANIKALNGSGLALDHLRRHDEAQIFYRRALQIDPEDRTVRNNFGLSLALSGRREEAVAVLRKLVSEPDALPRYRENLAYALSRRSAPASRAVPDRRI